MQARQRPAAYAADAYAANNFSGIDSDDYSDEAVAKAAANTARADDDAARTDYDHLLELHQATPSNLGRTIDPTENGPLGPLWPNGPPEWFTRLTNESTK